MEQNKRKQTIKIILLSKWEEEELEHYQREGEGHHTACTMCAGDSLPDCTVALGYKDYWHLGKSGREYMLCCRTLSGGYVIIITT